MTGHLLRSPQLVAQPVGLYLTLDLKFESTGRFLVPLLLFAARSVTFRCAGLRGFLALAIDPVNAVSVLLYHTFRLVRWYETESPSRAIRKVRSRERSDGVQPLSAMSHP